MRLSDFARSILARALEGRVANGEVTRVDSLRGATHMYTPTMRETLVTVLATLLIGLTAAAWFAGNEIENQLSADCWDIMECGQ